MSNLAWREIDWTLVHKRLSRQQRRVYKASIEGKRQIVHAIQRRIIRSLDAKLLAVLHVTIRSQEHNALSQDSVKVLSHKQKIELACGLSLDGKSNYIRRVYLSSTRAKKKIFQPLTISTIEEQAKQMLAKFALEPEWEAMFEPNSYGSRPGRSCHDAIASLLFSLRRKPQFILEVYIRAGFNEIDQDKLLAKMDTFSQMKNQIRLWLKENTMVGFENEPDEVTKILEGPRRGEIISPLLVNIALHGLENHIKNWYVNYCSTIMNYTSYERKKTRKAIIGFSRYINSFVITAPTFEDIVEIKKVVKKWLIKKVGLK